MLRHSPTYFPSILLYPHTPAKHARRGIKGHDNEENVASPLNEPRGGADAMHEPDGDTTVEGQMC